MEQKVNIFDAIEANKRNSIILIFFMSFILVIGVGLLGYALGLEEFGFVLSLVLTVVYVFFSYKEGAKTILEISGARRLKENEEPFLQNVVEGLALAANIPKPNIWVIENEGMNAFATGMDPKNSHIVFTRGLLKKMKREELEGVAAHEISHIANYDIRFATLAIVMVGAIAIIGDITFRWIRFGGRDSRKSGGLILIALLFAIVGPLFAELIRFALSREREYLADANGAKLTRYPEGLASALEKIKGNAYVNKATNATASLYIADPFEKKFAGFFQTHPPIEERIKRLRAM